jgi:hypothetical protein
MKTGTNIMITLLRLEFQNLFITSYKYISWKSNQKFRLSACLWLSGGEDLLNAHPLAPNICLGHSFRYILSQGAPGRENLLAHITNYTGTNKSEKVYKPTLN